VAGPVKSWEDRMATNPLSRTSTDATAITRGEIAARIDRLPLTRIQSGSSARTSSCS